MGASRSTLLPSIGVEAPRENGDSKIRRAPDARLPVGS
jgi:hypothetical protein